MRLEALNTPEGTYASPVHHSMPNAMGADYSAALLDDMVRLWPQFVDGGDGECRRNQEIANIVESSPLVDDLYRHVRSKLVEACDACSIPRFDPHWVEGHAVVFRDGGRFRWHSDHYKSSSFPHEETRTITYIYYMQHQPRAFTGGELEFFDGSMIDHEDDLLLWIDPWQRHQVREVRCPDPDPRVGRWAISGWVHRAPTGRMRDWGAWDDELDAADGPLEKTE